MCTIKRPEHHSFTRHQAGLSLIELIMFIVIVSVGIAGILAVLNQSSRTSADPLRRKQAQAIAESLLEEVQLARFTYCDPLDANAQTAVNPAACASTPETVGPEAGNVRPFDNVNDYVTAFASPKAYTTDVAGAALPTGYAATVTIQPASGLGPAGAQISADATPANMNLLRITVAVTYSATDSITLDGYRSRYAPDATP